MKTFIQTFLRDLREVCHPLIDLVKRLWSFWGPRLCNRAMWGPMFVNLTIAASGQDVWMWLGSHKLIALAIIGYNLVTPLSPAGAPVKLPPAYNPNDAINPHGGPMAYGT